MVGSEQLALSTRHLPDLQIRYRHATDLADGMADGLIPFCRRHLKPQHAVSCRVRLPFGVSSVFDRVIAGMSGSSPYLHRDLWSVARVDPDNQETAVVLSPSDDVAT